MRSVKIVMLLFFIFPLMLSANQSRGFEISGHVDGLKEGDIVKLGYRFAGADDPVWMDSCKVHEGKFHLKVANVEEGPRPYEVWFFGHWFVKKGHDDSIVRRAFLFIDNGDKIKIDGGDINKMMNGFDISDDLSIEGSVSNTAENALSSVSLGFRMAYMVINRKMNEIRDSIGFDRGLVQGLIESKFALDRGLEMALEAKPVFQAAVPVALLDVNLLEISHYHAAFVADLYKRLKDSVRNGHYGRELARYARLSVGQPMPDFNLPTVEGKYVILKEFVNKNKISLVHFWASNSYQREMFQQELRALYKKYHEKGLDIIGVSADISANEWKTRVLVEQYPWTNVSDLKGNQKGSITFDLYNEGGHQVCNTTNVLLDKDGKILAWDVYGPELQWYLWKYLGE